jgi:hypothetical protein
MGVPQDIDARRFWRSAQQRLLDAQYLSQGGRTTGAVYLAGYGVECMLKALLIHTTSQSNRAELVNSFRGAKAHDFEWLQHQYRTLNAPPIPQDIREHFVLASTWSTDFRYRPGIIEAADSEDFLVAAQAIINWADGRI